MLSQFNGKTITKKDLEEMKDLVDLMASTIYEKY